MNNPSHSDRLLAEALPEGIVFLDENDAIIWWNQVAERLLALAPAHKNQRISHVISHEKLIKLIAQPQGSIEIPARYDAATRLSLTLCPYWGEQRLLLAHDVTRTRHLEAMRQDFIANVSHELRTPLTVFHGYLELLQQHNGLDQEQLKAIITQMAGQSQRMERLVEDLLWLSRLEHDRPNKMDLQDVPVASILKNICEDATSLSGKNQHQFILEIDESVALSGQAEELRSAFSNLIFNAVHYTPKGGTITVRWFADAKGKHLSVEDTGVGIPEKHIPRITQRFYRIDESRTTRDKEGTGLGLAIVKHVLLRHNGTLNIKSELGKGSIFCCTFAQ